MSTSINYGYSHFDNIGFRKAESFLRPYHPPGTERELSLPHIWSATVHTNPDNAPAWRPNGRGGVVPRGAFPSRKALCAQPFVGSNERKYIHVCEADWRVVGYWMQPHKLEVRVEGYDRPLIYFPDVRREMADGTTEIVELKDSWAQIDNDADYARKLAIAKRVYAERGWRFSVETGEDNFSVGALFVRNASRIAHDNTTRITTADWMRLHAHMERRGGTSQYAEIVQALCGGSASSPGTGRAKLHAFVVRRILSIDLGMRLLPTTPVHLVDGNQGGV